MKQINRLSAVWDQASAIDRYKIMLEAAFFKISPKVIEISGGRRFVYVDDEVVKPKVIGAE